MSEDKGQELRNTVGKDEKIASAGASKSRKVVRTSETADETAVKTTAERKKKRVVPGTENDTSSEIKHDKKKANPSNKQKQSSGHVVPESSGIPQEDVSVPLEAPPGPPEASESLEVPVPAMKADQEINQHFGSQHDENSSPSTTRTGLADGSDQTKSPIPSKKADKEKVETADKSKEDGQEEIDESNAEDAEDEDNKHRHHIQLLDYHSMSMENLVGELQKLVRNEKVQAIKKHVDGIKYEFDHKFQEFLDHKKEEFISKGGNEIDFKYNSVTKRQFNEVYTEYREKRTQYYRNLDERLKANLNYRLELIDELRGLVNVEEDINTTYRNFKDIQEKWRNAGPIPRNSYNDVWRTYHHHIEIFYDFLHLNRELRDLDFRHNLEEKVKIVQRAEALAIEPDLNKAFRELQSLHKIWKEDIGPVGKEHRDVIWERFSNATKVLHQRRQDHHKELEKDYEKNLEIKKEIIGGLNEIGTRLAGNHKALQQQIKEVESLRERFFKAGKVPQSENEKTWAAFKDAVRAFNKNKNAYYKNLKHGQQENLERKRGLLDLALSLKDSEDWETATGEMKRIQGEWKLIGHVPRKYSDKIWQDFKTACNHYFDRMHARKNNENKVEYENFEVKNACLEKLKSYQLTGTKSKDLAAVKMLIEEWKSFGKVPFSKKGMNAKFNKILDALFRKLGVSRQESELLKYGNKIQQLANAEDNRAIVDERLFIRRKIDESKGELRQLENNLQFFSSASEDSPVVREVIQNIDRLKEAVGTWKAKLKKLNILENARNKEVAGDPGLNEEE